MLIERYPTDHFLILLCLLWALRFVHVSRHAEFISCLSIRAAYELFPSYILPWYKGLEGSD